MESFIPEILEQSALVILSLAVLYFTYKHFKTVLKQRDDRISELEENTKEMYVNHSRLVEEVIKRLDESSRTDEKIISIIKNTKTELQNFILQHKIK